MNSKVDVLAVMDEAIPGWEVGCDPKYRNDMREARAAVAELIEAANGVLRWESGDGRPERQRLRAALARVTGA